MNSGGNAGNAIGVGDTVGSVGVDGGSVANVTDIGVTANGGTAISDASGGDYNPGVRQLVTRGQTKRPFGKGMPGEGKRR